MSEWIKCKYESVSELEIPLALLDPSHLEGDTVQGIFYIIHSLGGEKAGYFRFKRKWYGVDIVRNQPMSLMRLKGVRVKFKHKWLDYPNPPMHYIRVFRTMSNAENITIL